MATETNLPDYGKVYEIASLGLYGHNIINDGQTSATGKVYNSVQCAVTGTISYVSVFPTSTIQAQTDATVTSLEVTVGQTYILGCVKSIAVSGGGKVVAHLISITE
tara:strand:+ start:1316 stop:1633 length:318 start_codon:yes stop_codon:yes gene_type:complete